MWAGSGHWLGVRTFNVTHSGVPLCLVLVGFLPLAVLRAGGQMEASGPGDPCVYLSRWGPCFGLSEWSGGHWGILAGLAFRLSGTDICPQGLAKFPISFYCTILCISLYFCNIAELCKKLN